MQVFEIAPGVAAVKGLWAVGAIGAVVMIASTVLVLWLVSASIAGARSSRFEITQQGLRLRGDVYGRLIPASEIRGDGARRVDFAMDRSLRPKSRTAGTSISGYQAGWFRLQNGEKALLYLTDRTRAVYVPTTAGYSVLVSPADPDRFLESLASLGTADPAGTTPR